MGCCAFYGRRSCLVSSSNSFNRRWFVRRSASISSVLVHRVSTVFPCCLLFTLSGWSCVPGGLVWLWLIFRVDTISHRVISFICKRTVIPTDGVKLMMFFQSKLGWSLEELLGRSAVPSVGLLCKNKKQKGLAGIARCLFDA